MSKVVIAGKAVVITSSLKLEDIETIKRFRPEALVLMGGENKDEPVFAISTSTEGSINKYGASFADATRGEGFATMTLGTSYEDEDIAEYIADTLGGALANLNKLEATLPDVLKEIDEARKEVMKNITVLQ